METQKDNRKYKIVSPLLVLTAGILWGCMGILVRSMTPFGFSSMEIVIFRAIVTGILMLFFMAVFRREELRIKLKDIRVFLGTGIASVTFFNFCYFSCMNCTTLSTAAVLLYTAPAFLLVMSVILFREKFTFRKILCLILTFAGCVLVSGGLSAGGILSEGGLSIKGLLFGLGAGFGYALYSVFSRFAIDRGYSSYTITTYTFIFASVGCAPFVKWRHFGECLINSGSRIVIFILLTVITTVLAYIVYTTGLSGVETGTAGIIASVEPVVASLIGFTLYGEKMSVPGIVGMALVLSGCIIIGIKKRE